MLHILRLPLSNVYRLTGERAVLIYTGRPSDAQRVLQSCANALRKRAHRVDARSLVDGGYLGGWLFPHRPGLHNYAVGVAQVATSFRTLLARAPTCGLALG